MQMFFGVELVPEELPCCVDLPPGALLHLTQVLRPDNRLSSYRSSTYQAAYSNRTRKSIEQYLPMHESGIPLMVITSIDAMHAMAFGQEQGK